MNTHILQWVLYLRTVKWPVLTAALSCLIALTLGSYVLWQQQARADEANRVTALRTQLGAQSAATLPPSVALPPEQVFASTLGEPELLDQYLRTLFDIAGKQDIDLKQGNYKTHSSTIGNHDVYTIDLPISGPYSKIKAISEEMLLALPFSALEEIKFKRETVGDTALETQLRFALYLKPSRGLVNANARPEPKMENGAREERGGRL